MHYYTFICQLTADLMKMSVHVNESSTSFTGGSSPSTNSQNNRDDTEKFKLEANQHFQNRRYDEALILYNKCLERDPTNAIYFANRSICYLKMERFENALEDASMAINCNRSYIKGYYRRADALMSLGNYKLALKDYKYVTKRCPNDDIAKIKFLDCYKIVKRMDFERAIAGPSNSPPSYATLERRETIALPEASYIQSENDRNSQQIFEDPPEYETLNIDREEIEVLLQTNLSEQRSNINSPITQQPISMNSSLQDFIAPPEYSTLDINQDEVNLLAQTNNILNGTFGDVLISQLINTNQTEISPIDDWMPLEGLSLTYLELFKSISKIFIEKDEENINILSSETSKPIMTVKNEAGQKMYFVASVLPLRKKSYDFNILDKNFREIIYMRLDMTAFPGCCWFGNNSIKVYAPVDNFIGSFEEKMTLCRPCFYVKDTDESIIFEVKENYTTLYTIFGRDGNGIGSVYMKRTRSEKQDFFGIDFPEALSTHLKIMLFCTAIVINEKTLPRRCSYE